MQNKILIVIDMQNDFVYGSLGSSEARDIVPKVTEKIRTFDGQLIFTRDTHQDSYMNSQEGRFLPVSHCIEGTNGWEIIPGLMDACQGKICRFYNKPTFGCTDLAYDLLRYYEKNGIESIEIIGVCTDICVVSNALMLKAFLPEVPMYVDSACCAGVTVAAHDAALSTMRSCQITVR